MNVLTSLRTLLLSALLFSACTKPATNDPAPTPPQPPVVPAVSAPVVRTDAAVAAADSTTLNGTVTADGGGSITARGFVYATTPNPGAASATVAAGSGTGAFAARLSGLLPATRYYYRAFATNSAGTAYGADQVFTTPAAPVVVPTDSAETIYVTGADKLYAFNARNGQQKWVRNLPAYSFASPAYANGLVYITSANKLFCYDSSGTARWTVTGANDYLQSPLIDGPRVITFDNSGKAIAYDAQSGSPVWSYTGSMQVSSEPFLDNGTLYINAFNLVALNSQTGQLRWTASTQSWTEPLLLNNRIYVAGDTRLQAYDATTGTQVLNVYDYNAFNNVVALNSAFGSVYAIRENNGLAAFDPATGSARWSVNVFPTHGVVSYGSGRFPLVADSLLLVPRYTGLTAYDPFTGAERWHAPADDMVSTVTYVAGIAYYGSRQTRTNSGHFYARNVRTNTTLWVSTASDDFNTSAPCVVTRSGKVWRAGIGNAQ